ncbi:hypothetical protein Salat_1744000 [Sesamum alatum]|uniref:Uncharacterized protein n=1 Tax=Sesamum alatum TaxID=300844 RepID=A0AAE1Y892_9LAMI|nr:hypothetical protein Salat_1744000 [Sesamum alatum]
MHNLIVIVKYAECIREWVEERRVKCIQNINLPVIPQSLPPFDLVDEKYVRHAPPLLSDTPVASPPPSNTPGPACTPHAPAQQSYALDEYTPHAPPPPSYAPEVADALDAAPDSPLPSYDAVLDHMMLLEMLQTLLMLFLMAPHHHIVLIMDHMILLLLY